MTTLQRSLAIVLLGLIFGFGSSFLIGFSLIVGIFLGVILGLLAAILFPLLLSPRQLHHKETTSSLMTDDEIKTIGRKETMKIVLIVFAGVIIWNALLVAFDVVSNGAIFSKMSGFILQMTIIQTIVALIIPSVLAYFMGARASIQIIKNKKSKLFVGFKTVFFIGIICIQLYLLFDCLLRLTTTTRTLSEIIIYDYIQGWAQFLFIIFWLPGAFLLSFPLGYFLGKRISDKALTN